jgi:hypothetical protein
MPVAKNLKDMQQQSIAAATRSEVSSGRGRAVREYEEEKLALLADTVRLRALRLAKEAADTQQIKIQLAGTKSRQSAKKEVPRAKSSSHQPDAILSIAHNSYLVAIDPRGRT